MIDINLYRSRIGSFNHSSRRNKLNLRKIFRRHWTENDRTGVDILSVINMVMKLVLILAFLQPDSHQLSSQAFSSTSSPALSACWMPATAYSQAGLGMAAWTRSSQAVYQFQIKGKRQTNNFLAKCKYGNRKKGIYNAHLNIRSLSNKVNEVKSLIKEHSPNILGLSECELRKINNQYDEAKLKIPGYKILFPKTWNTHGFARVIVYVKNSLEFEQVFDLEEEQVQSIWLKGGFKNGKRIFFCHGYREHTSSMGNTLNAQRSNLELFLYQWEAAVNFGNPSEPNEVHICCDMNLDSLNDRWLQSDYNLVSLSRLVQNCCNTNNFSQLVKEATRVQFNSVQNTTSISCIDHVYTNVKYRCSATTVTSFGNSDHDMISYSRYSKEPPIPARTIRKRSYKNFVAEKYLDVSKADWTEVLACEDLDTATELFTRNLRYILNVHAPWIVFQQRKFFTPWITEETKQLMKHRDQLKQTAKDLALRDFGQAVSEEQQEAWKEFKKVRNKINNKKKQEETFYKSSKISEDLDSPSKLWSTAKSFMGWKTTGTPSQLEINNTLETKASNIARIMNEFFIDKVLRIQNGLQRVPERLQECMNIMRGKECKLDLQHVTVGTVQKLLKNLKSSRSTSVDELDSFAVKLAADQIALPLHHIITLSIMQKKFPTSWKYTKLIPLHKKLSQLEPKNYRPVAILSPLSKILEKIVYQQIYGYFSSNKLFHENLHGYRQNRSTQTALLQMYDGWVRAASAGQVSGVVLIDLSAAFDLVDSEILIKKLRIYGLHEDLLLWVRSYLTDRHQAVWIDHIFSEFVSHSI